ncbi:uncharacterized protein [Medicago truncatula]|uniref:uncharacterized protein isoform X3 n=1 Tax=Medicago truncatula TaxID=3880 RepID=UPI000D2F3259|nr:uncharacterized protein LOC11433362 isoform X3 [Medicago truncatula]
MTAIVDSDNILLNISSDEINDFISEYTLEGKWDSVIRLYNKFPEQAHTAIISDSAGTALHVAIDLDEEFFVEKLVHAILMHNNLEALEIGNEHGDTPLHFAASRGFARICKCIIGSENERIYLLSCKNKNGETPFFQAAVNWRKQAFAYLAHISKGMVNLQELLVRNDGDSVLHTAIQGEHFDLAVIIANYYAFLSTHQNEEVSTPLYLLANKPSAFKSSSSLPWYKRILYYSIHVEPVDAERTMWSILREMEAPQIWIQTFGFPSNYITLCDFYQGLIVILSGKWFKKKKQHDIEDPSNDNRRPFNSENNLEGVLPPNYKTFRLFVRCISELTLRLFGDLKHIKIAKNNHIWSSQLLKALLKNAALTKRNYLDPVYMLTVGTSRMIEEKSERDKMAYVKEKAPILVAARNGIYEMVKEILIEAPTALRSTNSSKQNVLLVAVEYRKILVVKTLRKILESKHWNSASSKQEKLWNSASSKREEILNSASSKKEKLWNSLVLAKDDKQNTILHLAAEAQAVDKPGQNIARSALQMMWDMKWFQLVCLWFSMVLRKFLCTIIF